MASPEKNKGAKKSHGRPSESFYTDAQPSTSFKDSTVEMSSLRIEKAQGKRKVSMKKLSIEPSALPMNDDSDEVEKEKSIAENEKSLEKSSRRSSGEEEHDSSIIKTMSKEQMNEHVNQCLQLSTENKINTKNAFALKLIDCMTIITKSEDKSNFTAMACQLDAGAKIYSSRVDAVHQQVMKLVETCMYAENKKKEAKDDDDENDEGEGKETKEKRKKSKKNVIATNDQISRLPKEKDPRDKFVKLEALPGEILKQAKYDPTDLSLTLERNVPFWLNASENKHLIPEEETTCIPDMEIKDKSERTQLKLDVEVDVDLSCLSRPSTSKAQFETENSEFDLPADYDSEPNDNFQDSDVEQEKKEDEEIEVVSLAKSRMVSEGSNVPTTTEVIKTIFHSSGESDYHYLKMDSQRFWAGPSHWKRPLGSNLAEEKKKIVRRKKEPAEVLYTDIKTGKSPKATASKKAPTLSKRTTDKWSTRKTTLPQDINFDPDNFNRLFHMNAFPEAIQDKQEDRPTAEESDSEDIESQPFVDMFAGAESDDSSTSTGSGFHGFPPPTLQERSPACALKTLLRERFGPDVMELPSASHADDDSDTGSGFRGWGSEEDVSPETGEKEDVKIKTENVQEYDGENLVPMVRTVQVEPIKFSAKPSRVDMQHLKQVMLSIIRRSIEDRENKLKGEGDQSQSPRVSVPFESVLKELYSSDQLHRRTKEDLTTQMAFLAALFLANENNFSLKQENDLGDFYISYNNA